MKLGKIVGPQGMVLSRYWMPECQIVVGTETGKETGTRTVFVPRKTNCVLVSFPWGEGRASLA